MRHDDKRSSNSKQKRLVYHFDELERARERSKKSEEKRRSPDREKTPKENC